MKKIALIILAGLLSGCSHRETLKNINKTFPDAAEANMIQNVPGKNEWIVISSNTVYHVNETSAVPLMKVH